jgi:hypothetical protein
MDHTNIPRIASSLRLRDVNRLRPDSAPAVYEISNSLLRELFLERGEPRAMDLAEARATLEALQTLANNFEAAIQRSCGVRRAHSLTERNSS